MMPSMNGFELIKNVKEDDALKDIFIAAITGLTADEEIKKLFSLGADYYISKPIQKDDIVARLNLIYKLVDKQEQSSLEFIRDSFNPFKTEVMMNCYTVFTILQEDDFYQIIHHLFALYPNIYGIALKDFITHLLKSYGSMSDENNGAFEMMLESSSKEIYLSCTHLNFIKSMKVLQSDIPSSYEVKYTNNGITIKIPLEGE